MSNDAGNEKPSSIEVSKPSSPAELDDLLTKTKDSIVSMHQLAQNFEKLQGQTDANFEKLQGRVTWLTRLEATRAEHVLALSGAVNNQAQSRDRQTEAVLLLTQKFSEFSEDLKYSRAGIDAILLAVNNDKKLKRDLQKAIARGVREGSKQAIVQGVREASQSFITHRVPTVEAEEAKGAIAGVVAQVARIAALFFKARLVTQVLAFFFAVFALATFLGYLLFKIHATADLPQGAPIERKEPSR